MKNIKKLLVLMCVFACVFSLSACGNNKKDEKEKSLPLSNYSEEEDLINGMVTTCDEISNFSAEEKDEYLKYFDSQDGEIYEAYANMIRALTDAAKEFGGYEGLYYDGDDVKYTLTVDDDVVSVKVKAKYKKRDAYITMNWKDFQTVDSSTGYVMNISGVETVNVEGKYSLAEKMKTAGLNTLMGISIVVVVLAFLSILISLFKYINIAQKAIENSKNKKVESPIDTTISQIVEKEETNSVDDEELVAVIAAAIAAAEHTTVDGFVVRSVKKVPNRKWR